jgi:hypothetical protein
MLAAQQVSNIQYRIPYAKILPNRLQTCGAASTGALTASFKQLRCSVASTIAEQGQQSLLSCQESQHWTALQQLMCAERCTN